jgi:hypothetical protein
MYASDLRGVLSEGTIRSRQDFTSGSQRTSDDILDSAWAKIKQLNKTLKDYKHCQEPKNGKFSSHIQQVFSLALAELLVRKHCPMNCRWPTWVFGLY